MDRTSSRGPGAASCLSPDAAMAALRDWRHILSTEAANSPLCEFARYVAVSGFAFAGDFATLIVLTEFAGIHYLASAALGFGLGILITYVLCVRWVFANRRLANAHVEWLVFLFIGIGGLAINHVVIAGLTELAHVPYAVSKLFSVGLVFTFNFGLRKLLLFTASVACKE